MEPWQIEHVCKHIESLKIYTQCNAKLVACLKAANAINYKDADLLNTVRNKDGKLPQAFLLYEILKSRAGSYEKLANALFKCRQTGALKIILAGFQEARIENILQTCEIDIDFEDILSTTVEVEGRTHKLRDVTGISVDDMKTILKTFSCEVDFIDTFITGDNKLVLLENTIPMPPSIYIPRSISNRPKLNPKIFKENCPDVFVFKGIKGTELESYLKPLSFISTSTSQIYDLTSRFILLVDEVDWDQIKILAASQSFPAHLIRFENNHSENVDDNDGDEGNDYLLWNESDDVSNADFILDASIGNSTVLFHYVEGTSQHNDCYLTEEDFVLSLKEEKTSSGICICDTPGMGKSWLLANLARKIPQQYPGRLAAFIPLSQFIQNIGAKHTGPELTDQIVLELVLKQVSPTSMSRAFLCKGIHNYSCHLDLFFDGFDEVPMEFIDWTKRFLKLMASVSKNINIFITSRPQLRRELESTLGVIAYDMLPFTMSDQEECLQRRWKETNPQSNEQKLGTFTKACLTNLKGTISDQERDISGIPLQCYLLGEVYSKQATLYSDPCRNQELPIFKLTTIHELYKAFIEIRLDDQKLSQEVDDLSSVKRFHLWKALQLLYPEVASHYANRFNFSEDDSPSDYLAFGILEVRNNPSGSTVEFLHRTIAEFLVAEYISGVLYPTSMEIGDLELNKSVVTCTFQNMFSGSEKYKRDIIRRAKYKYYEFNSQSVTYFLNAQIALSNTNLVNQELMDLFLDAISPSVCFQILYCSIIQKSIKIFEFLRSILGMLRETQVDNFKKYFVRGLDTLADDFLSFIQWDFKHLREMEAGIAYSLMCATSKHSNVQMMRELFRLFKDCFQHDLHQLCREMINVSEMTPLQFALQLGNYEIVEYLMHSFNLENPSLLYHCIVNSYWDPKELITKRLDICKLIVSKRQVFWNEICKSASGHYKGRSGHEPAERVHPVLLKYLCGHVSDSASTQVKPLLPIVLASIHYMSSEDFEDLFRHLITSYKSHILTSSGSNSLAHYIFRYARKISVCFSRFIIDTLEVSVDEKDKDGNTLLLLAVQGKGNSVELIKWLVEYGFDYNVSNQNGETMMHLAAASGNIENVKYVSSLGLSYSMLDKTGASPFLRTVENLEVLEHFLAKGADVLQKDKKGYTIAHIGAIELTKNDFHKLVTILLKYDPSGAIFQIKNQYGRTPLHSRVSHKSFKNETMELILANPDIQINQVDKDGNNVFLLAVKGGRSLAALKFFISHGANYEIFNKTGYDAFTLACKNGNMETMRYLLSVGGIGWLTKIRQKALKQIVEMVYDMSISVLISCEALQMFFTLLEIPLEGGVQYESSTSHKISKEISMLTNTYEKRNLLFVLLKENYTFKFSNLLLEYSTDGPEPTEEMQGSQVPTERSTFRGINVLKPLIVLGLNLMEVDDIETTFLDHIALNSTPEDYHNMVEFLIYRGFGNVFRTNNADEESPLHNAISYLEILPETLDIILVDSGININATDNIDRSLLLLAVLSKKSLGLIHHMVTNGADYFVKNEKGKNLAQISKKLGLTDHLEYFVGLGCDVNDDEDDDDENQSDTSEPLVDLANFNFNFNI